MVKSAPGTEFLSVTEEWDMRANPEQLARAYIRFREVRDIAKGGRILDVGCGTGYGLPYLSSESELVVGSDLALANLSRARKRLPTFPLITQDGQRLALRDASFDVVSCLEAIYYFPQPDRFLAEAWRVLRPGGRVFLTAPNPDIPALNKSPHSVSYYTADDLREMLTAAGFEATISGAFPVEDETTIGRAREALRRFAARAGIIPKSMRVKALVKRVLYRNMTPLSGFETAESYAPPVQELPPNSQVPFKVLLAVGTRVG